MYIFLLHLAKNQCGKMDVSTTSIALKNEFWKLLT